ncbi:hypothetical protein HanHA89_Chr06g0212521 [Helianthus annuus]|nr:hypothetical protein HanHA89_Chr06g0212521 [Helianthus annuus]
MYEMTLVDKHNRNYQVRFISFVWAAQHRENCIAPTNVEGVNNHTVSLGNKKPRLRHRHVIFDTCSSHPLEIDPFNQLIIMSYIFRIENLPPKRFVHT